MRKIIVHGGAGRAEVEFLQKRQEKLEEAAEVGLNSLIKEGPEGAVEKAINVLEDSGLFNAGRGAAIQLDGEVRLDASIMNSALQCGAVASMPGIRNAVSIAKLVMEETPHVLLVGEAAAEFALAFGFTKEDLKSPERFKRWQERVEKLRGLPYRDQVSQLRELRGQEVHGTVGAVAVKDGQLAAATSTGGRGGMPMLKGRVGDTPIIGAGTYCNEYGGASATGAGEDIIRVCLARKVIDLIEAGLHPQNAAEKAMAFFEQKTRSRAGVIALDRLGNQGAAFNTEQMLYVVREG